MQIHSTGEDYSSFYETKIKEYWDWKAEVDGTREKSGKELSLREEDGWRIDCFLVMRAYMS